MLCYLPLNTSKHTPPEPQPARLVLDLPTPEGCWAELTQVTWLCPSRESNLWPLAGYCNAVTAMPPRHPWIHNGRHTVCTTARQIRQGVLRSAVCATAGYHTAWNRQQMRSDLWVGDMVTDSDTIHITEFTPQKQTTQHWRQNAHTNTRNQRQDITMCTEKSQRKIVLTKS